MASTAGRRKSAGTVTTTQTMAPSGVNGGGGSGKRPSNSAATRNRIDPSLMMSTNTKKSSEDVRNFGGGGHAKHNKSSDRLHRMGGGSSSTNLAQNKRSKSYSQLMSAGAGATASGKKKKKEDKGEEDEDGWTSSSQKGTPEESRSPNSGGSEDEDEGLVMGPKKKQNQRTEAAAVTATTPQGPEMGKNKEETRVSLNRTDTQVTLRGGFHTTPTQENVSLPVDESSKEAKGQEGEALDQRQSMSDDQTHSQADSDDTLAQGPSTPELEQVDHQPQGQHRPPIDRGFSSASAKTLTTEQPRGELSSPASNRSRHSMHSMRARTSLYPRDSQGPVAPKLSTQYALAGALGSLQEDSEFDQAMGQPRRRYLSDVGIANSRSEPGHLRDVSIDSVVSGYHIGGGSSSNNNNKSARRKSSISSIRSNTIKLPSASPSMADVSLGAVRVEHGQQGSGSSALDAMHRASTSGFHHLPHDERKQYDRRRTTSTQSLSAADAANLATRLRMARGESFDEAHTTSASKLLANSSSKYFTLSSNRNDVSTTKAMKEYNKPIISTFVKRLGERKNIEVKVGQGSLFDEDFARAKLSGSKGGGGGGHSMKRKEEDEEDDDDDDDEDDDEPPSVRYVMDFGLSGPAVHKTPTTEALLSTLLDYDEFEATWAPALANAAGLGEGTRRAREAAREGGVLDNMQMNGLTSTGGVAVNGPNATPMHFLHGLTNTTDAPFPLDASDMVTAAAAANSNNDSLAPALVSGGDYLDAKNLRSIAMTWTALNVNKGHVVTRRYVDPMRESLERVERAGGLMTSRVGGGSGGGGGGGSHSHSQYPTNVTPNSGSTTPGGSLRWGAWRNLFSEQHTLQEES